MRDKGFLIEKSFIEDIFYNGNLFRKRKKKDEAYYNNLLAKNGNWNNDRSNMCVFIIVSRKSWYDRDERSALFNLIFTVNLFNNFSHI